MINSIHKGALRLAGLSALGASPADATVLRAGPGKTAGALMIQLDKKFECFNRIVFRY